MQLLKKISLLICACMLCPAWLATAEGAQDQARQEVTAEKAEPQTVALSLSGEKLVSWAEPDGTQILMYKGDFRAKGLEETLSSDRAVIWLKQVRQAGQVHSSVRLYLEGNVQLKQSSGTLTKDEVLLTHMEVSGVLVIGAVERVDQPQRDDALYKRAGQALPRPRWDIRIDITGPRSRRFHVTRVD